MQHRATLQRRLFHLVAGSVFPTLVLLLPQTPVLALAIALALGAVVGEAARFLYRPFNSWFVAHLRILLKHEEEHSVTGSTYMLLATVLAVWLLERPIAALALFYLSVGDSVAALVGERLGKHKVFGKSAEGSAAFLAASFAVMGILLAAGVHVTPLVASLGALCAALVELLPLPVDDNLAIPLASGGAMALASRFLA